MKKRNVSILTLVFTLLCLCMAPVNTFAQPEEEIETYEAPDVAIAAKIPGANPSKEKFIRFSIHRSFPFYANFCQEIQPFQQAL